MTKPYIKKVIFFSSTSYIEIDGKRMLMNMIQVGAQ